MTAAVSFRDTITATMITNNEKNRLDEQKTVRSYGISPPISLKHPDASDLLATQSLEETLRAYDYFESDVELTHRFEVLTKLNTLTRDWIRKISLAKMLPPEVVENVGGGVHTFGSYRLGVHSKGGDIDTLVIAPRHIDRADFLNSFVEYLRRQNEVCNLRAVEDAFVPVIKLTFDGIELDMLFARLALPTIPDTLDLKDDRLLQNLDHRCVRSLNGCRVADEILDLVPNHETFRSTLRAIKLWAKKCGLYSNALGFFGGITWAILVARICQLYPNAAAATLVHKFFLVYSKWDWPTPVLLKMINDVQHEFPVWDPNINNRDRNHLMPIITPAYPQQNSTHNVTQSTQKLIVQEIKRGLDIVNQIIDSKANWKELFTGISFFGLYKHYIILTLSASDQNQYLEWSGLVEAKIRFLIGNLERNRLIDIAHVSPEKYSPDDTFKLQQQTGQTLDDGTSSEIQNSSVGDSKQILATNRSPNADIFNATNNTRSVPFPSTVTKSSTTSSGIWIIGLKFKRTQGQIDLTNEISAFISVVYTVADSSNMNHENVILEARYTRRRDLSTVLPRHVLFKSYQSPSSFNSNDADERTDSVESSSPKRMKLDSPPSQLPHGDDHVEEPSSNGTK